MKLEHFTKDQLDTLIRMVGPIGAQVCRLGDVDISKGRGITSDQDRCVWTHDNHRIDIDVGGGSLIVNLSKEPDPDAPKSQTLEDLVDDEN